MGTFSLTLSVWIFSTKIYLGVGKILSYKLKYISQSIFLERFLILVIFFFICICVYIYNKRDPHLTYSNTELTFTESILDTPVHLFRGRILILLFQVLLLRY